MLNILSATVGEVFAYIGYVLLALLALMAMIVVHELGHYTAGKLLGFKIDEFAIGFGPKIFKRKNKKTGELFSIRPFPIGGFCAFHGEDADGALLDENGNQVKDANGNIIKDPDAFNNQKPWKRLIVLFSGAFMNFLSAILIITIYFSAYGQPLPYVVGTYDVPSYQNVFEQGDVLLSVNGKQINLMAQEDLDNVFKKVGDNAEFRVLRNGKRIKITASKFFYDPFEDGDYIYAVDGKKLDTPVAYADYLATVESNDAFIVTVVRYDEKGGICEQSTMKVQKGANPEDANGFYSYGFGITRTIARAKLPFFLAFGRAWSFCFFIVFKILASFGALITGKWASKEQAAQSPQSSPWQRCPRLVSTRLCTLWQSSRQTLQ